MTIEELEIRFGPMAVGKGFITSQQLVAALNVQVREGLTGAKHRPIGKILHDMGYLTIDQIGRVLGSMRSHGFPMHSQSVG